MTRDDVAITAAGEREIRELHRFFVDWMGGVLAPSDAAFARLEAALAPGFTMVTPDARRLARAEVVGWLRAAHGARRNPASPFAIGIEDVALLHVAPAFVLLGYVETQRLEGRRTARRSTVLFARDPAGPNGLRWLAVHETWVAA